MPIANQVQWVGVRNTDPIEPIYTTSADPFWVPFANAGSGAAEFILSLDTISHRYITCYYELDAVGDVYLEISIDNVTWRVIDTISLTAAGSGFYNFETGYRFVRLRGPTAGVTYTFEISAKR